jgi:hypothetical protein
LRLGEVLLELNPLPFAVEGVERRRRVAAVLDLGDAGGPAGLGERFTEARHILPLTRR